MNPHLRTAVANITAFVYESANVFSADDSGNWGAFANLGLEEPLAEREGSAPCLAVRTARSPGIRYARARGMKNFRIKA